MRLAARLMAIFFTASLLLPALIAGPVSADGGPADATQSTISASPGTTGNGTSTVTVQLNDGAGDPLTIGGDTVTLSSNLGSVGTVVDNSDGTYTATLTSAHAGTATVTGTVNGDPISDDAVVTVDTGTADVGTSTLTTSPISMTTDGSSTITVQLKDADGVDLTTSGGIVTLQTDKGSLSGVVDHHDGSYSSTLTSTSTGTAHITGKLDGTTITDPKNVVIDPGAASRITSTITATPPSATTDDTSTITIQAKDAAGNDLSAGGDPFGLSASPGSVTGFTDVGDGTYTATLRSASTGTAHVTGTLNSLTMTHSADVDFTPGVASISTTTITASPISMTTDGSALITIQLEDAGGNDLTSSGGTVTLSSDHGSLSGLTDHGDGTWTATLTSGFIGVSKVTGQLDGTDIDDSASVTVTVGAAAKLAFSQEPGDSTGGIASSTQPIVDIEDAAGNLRSAATNSVTLALTTPGGATLTCTANPKAASSGQATFAGCRVDKTGTYTLTATAAGLTSAVSAPFDVTVGSASVATSTITALPTSMTTDDSSVITVQLKDAGGNDLSTSDGVVTLSATPGLLSGVTDNDDGTYTANLTSLATGSAVVSGKLDGVSFVDTATVTVGVGAADPTTSTVTAAPISMTTDGSSVITVQLKDEGGNDLTTGGDDIVLATDLGSLTPVVDHGNGTYTATLASGVLGTAHVTGELNTVAMDDTASVVVSVGAPAQLVFTTQPVGGPSGSAWTTQPAVSIRDAHGNFVPSAVDAVTLAITTPAGAILTCTSNPQSAVSGLATFAGCAIDRPGIYTLRATATGLLDVTSDPLTITNAAPVAVADGVPVPYQAKQATALVVPAASGVLANDTDVDNLHSALTAVLDTAPTHGSLTLNADGSFTYTSSDTIYHGPDSFMYHANDGTDDSNIVSVAINVYINHAPTAVADVVTVVQGSGYVALNLLANDNTFNPDAGEILRITHVTNPPRGSATITGGGTGVSYRPDSGFSGTDSFSYTVSDGVLSAVGTVLVKVPKDTYKPTVTAPVQQVKAQSIGSSTLKVYVSWTGADRGYGISKYEVWTSVNGHSYTKVATTSGRSYTFTAKVGTSYRVRVRAIDKKGNVGSYAYGPTFKPYLYQETSASYTGTWGPLNSSSLSGGHDRSTTELGAAATFATTGRTFTWIALRSTVRGTADVYVDSILRASVNLAASSTTYRYVAYSITFLTSGTHTIQIVYTGPNTRRVDVDAFVVLR